MRIFEIPDVSKHPIVEKQEEKKAIKEIKKKEKTVQETEPGDSQGAEHRKIDKYV